MIIIVCYHTLHKVDDGIPGTPTIHKRGKWTTHSSQL